MDIFFCQIDVEISKAILIPYTKQFVVIVKQYNILQDVTAIYSPQQQAELWHLFVTKPFTQEKT